MITAYSDRTGWETRATLCIRLRVFLRALRDFAVVFGVITSTRARRPIPAAPTSIDSNADRHDTEPEAARSSRESARTDSRADRAVGDSSSLTGAASASIDCRAGSA